MDALGAAGDRLQAGGAEAVDGDARAAVRQAGAQGDDAGDVEALLGLGHRAAEGDVVDEFEREAREVGEGRRARTWAARSSGRVLRSVPFWARPTALRRAATMTAS
jgi:hypothetical protein